jgi:hypothetical protein
VTWTGANVAGYAVGTLPGETLPSWLDVSVPAAASSPSTITVRRKSNPLPPGHYQATLRVVTGDASQNVIKQADFTVALEIYGPPQIGAASITENWVESEQPATQQLTITGDPRIATSATVDVPWLDVSMAGGVITLAGNAQAQALAPGNVSGNLHATYTVGAATTNVSIPISGAVSRALSAPAQLTYVIDGSTTAASLISHSATVTSATASPASFTVQSNVPWLTVTGSTTAADLSIALQSAEIGALEYGTYNGTIHVQPSNPNITPLDIPVALDMHVPEVHMIAPVAFTDSLTTDYVVVRGTGLADPSATLKIDGASVAGANLTPISDTEVRLIPAGLAVGDHSVTVDNALGLTRTSATLRVVDPPAYASYTLAAAPDDFGAVSRVVASAANGMVFSANCFFCDGGGAETVHRFAYDAGTSQWTVDTYTFPGLIDIALSLDESRLFVLTSDKLLAVDPVTMAAIGSPVSLPALVDGAARQLAATNDGLVVIDSLKQGLDLRTGKFVPVGLNTILGGLGIASSADGSRLMFGEDGLTPYDGTVPLGYYDASLGTVVLSSTFEQFSGGFYDRHADRALTSFLLDGDLSEIQQLPPPPALRLPDGKLSPDGKLAYFIDFGAGELHTWDAVANPPTELPVRSTAVFASRASWALDAYGATAFVVGASAFIVIDLR